MPTVAECSGACWPNSFMGMGRSTIAKAMENVLISPGEPSSPNDWMLKRLIPCLENNLFSTSANILKALTVIIRICFFPYNPARRLVLRSNDNRKRFENIRACAK